MNHVPLQMDVSTVSEPMQQISLRCPAENRVIGVVAGSAGARIDEHAFRFGYEAADGYALDVSTVKNGVQMLCPRCRNPLVFHAGRRGCVRRTRHDPHRH